MADLLNFLENRKVTHRYKRFLVFGSIFLVLAALSAGGFYLLRGDKDKTSEDVASGEQLPEDWLLKYFGVKDENHEKVGGPYGDPDADILTNLQEYLFGTDPTKDDTDGDGTIDSMEIAFGQNPNGEGSLVMTSQADEYVRNYISSNDEFKDFSQENILQEVKGLFLPNKIVVMDFPDDKELVITDQNDVPSFEQYYNDTKGMTLEKIELEHLASNLFVMQDDEVDQYAKKLAALIEVLKTTPVPRELVDIHKAKIAGMWASLRILELVRDNYNPENLEQEFWSDFSFQVTAAQEAGILEMSKWYEVGKVLQEKGGL